MASRPGQDFPHNPRILSRKEIEAVLKQHLPAIKRCHTVHAGKDAMGRLILDMLIRPEGAVLRVQARAPGAKDPERLQKCISDLSRRWRFPKREGFTNATIPFEFRKRTQVLRHAATGGH